MVRTCITRILHKRMKVLRKLSHGEEDAKHSINLCGHIQSTIRLLLLLSPCDGPLSKAGFRVVIFVLSVTPIHTLCVYLNKSSNKLGIEMPVSRIVSVKRTKITLTEHFLLHWKWLWEYIFRRRKRWCNDNNWALGNNAKRNLKTTEIICTYKVFPCCRRYDRNNGTFFNTQHKHRWSWSIFVLSPSLDASVLHCTLPELAHYCIHG